MMIEIGVFVVALSTFTFYWMYRASRRSTPPAWLGGDLLAPNLIALLLGGIVIGGALIGRFLLDESKPLSVANWIVLLAIAGFWLLGLWLVRRWREDAPESGNLVHLNAAAAAPKRDAKRKRAA